MATVCGSTLSLMDAGVPIKAPVAGIAMGLILEGDETAILSDILGDEDHIGDMDFKVAGTAEGVTAIQMDIKIRGISKEIMQKVLEQAREGRLHILGKMKETLAEPRKDLSRHAPRIVTLQVKQEKIRDIIGPGGKTIRSIVEQTGVKVDVEDSGLVKLASPNYESIEKAIAMIKRLTQEVEVGGFYTGKVRRILGFGAIVELFAGTDGLVHISQLAEGHVKEVSDVLKEGDDVFVKVIDIDPQGRIRLSRKAALKEKPDETKDKGIRESTMGASGYRKTILENGIKVITEEIPYLKSVSTGVWAITGSRDEHPHENGISHFIEHLLFKGTERRTAFDIAKEIDSVGGTLNAFTGREYTCYYAKVIDQNFPLAIDLLSDIFLHPLIEPNDVEKERMVILQEIKMVEDTPDDYIHDLFNRVCWGEPSLGFADLWNH